MFSALTRHSLWLGLLILFVMAPFLVVAQERVGDVASSKIRLDFSFTIVAPLDGEKVSGTFLLLLHSDDQITRAAATISSPGEKVPLVTLSIDPSSRQAEWDTSSAPDGPYQVVVEACEADICLSRSKIFHIANATAPPIRDDKPPSPPSPIVPPSESEFESLTPEPSEKPIPPVPGDRVRRRQVAIPAPSPADPSPQIPPPLPPEPLFTIFPPNVFSLVEIRNRADTNTLLRGSGEQFQLPSGIYNAHVTIPKHPLVSIALERFSVDQDAQLFQITPLSSPPILSIKDINYNVQAAYSLSFGFPFERAILAWAKRENGNLFYCSSPDSLSNSCRVTWQPVPVSKNRFELISLSQENWIVYGIPQTKIQDPLPIHSIILSNAPGEFFLLQPPKKLGPFDGNMVDVEEGRYTARLHFHDLPLSVVRLEDVNISHSGTVFTSQPIPLSPDAIDRNITDIFHFDVGFNFDSWDFRLDKIFEETINYCTRWSTDTLSCGGQWVASPSPVLEPGVNVFGFTRKEISATPTIPDINASSDDLDRAIAWLQRLHAGKRFFYADDARASYSSLETLFSQVEINLECPSPAPFIQQDATTPIVDPSPREGFPSPPSSNPLSTPPDVSSQDHVPSSNADGEENGSSNPPSNPSFPPRGSPLFYTNDWEDHFPNPPGWRQREDILSCGGISLRNYFDPQFSPRDSPNSIFIGRSDNALKQQFVLANNDSVPRTRIISIRLHAPFPSILSETENIFPSPLYRLVYPSPDTSPFSHSTIRFLDEDVSQIGFYDFSDLITGGFDPLVVVHRKAEETVIDTLLEITLLPGQSILLDPHYFLSSSANYTARWSGGIASDRLGALNALTTENVPNAPGEGVQLLNLDNGSYANDLLIAAPLADTNSKADAGALYMVLNIDSRMGNFDMNTPSSYDARFSGSRAGDMLTYPTQVGKGFQVFDADGDGSTNDLLVVAGSATFTGANAGSLYFIQDIHSKSGLLDLNNLNNFTARWDGLSNSRLGWTGYSGDAFDVYDVDADGILDDLVLSLPFGDTQSRTDNGALYLINNVTSRSGINPLSSSSSYTVAYHGATASDKIGGDLNGGLGYQIVNMDGNASANDVVLVAPFADLLQGFFFILNDNGGVYIIPDFNTRTGDVDLSSVFFPLFNGKLDNDNVGYSNDSNLTAQIVNTDGNANANDLLITCILCDNSRTDNGSIHLFKDAHLRTAATDLTTSDVYWTPMVNLDQFGYTAGGGLGAQVVNLDGNVAANDMIVTCARCNTASILENGTVYIFRDINTLSGAKALSVSSNYYLRFYGATNYDRIGDIGKSGQSVQLVNTDGNALANDLVFGSRAVTTSPGITGAVYFVRDLLSFSGSLTLATSSNYTARWSPPSVDDNFGYTNNSGPGIQIVNLDNGIATNDLIVTAVRADINSKTNAGGVWVMKDINTLSGQIILDTDANYSVRFNGGKTEDYLGYTIQGGQGTWMVNLDNNAYSNDLVLAAASADTTLQDAGSVYIIQDVDFKSGNIDLDTNTNYLKRYSGGDANLFLGSTQYGGSGLRLLDSDGDSFLDLFLTSVQADINGKPQSGVLYRIEDVYRFLDVGLDYSFTLSLPADGCTDGKGNFSGGTSCQRGWVGATSDTQTQVQPEGQDVDNTISFFVLDNQSTTSSDFNVFLDLNAALPGTIVFKASNSKSGYQSTCSGNPANNCVTLSTTKKSVGTAIYSAGTQDLNIFFWADFTSAPDGNVDRNVGSTAQSP